MLKTIQSEQNNSNNQTRPTQKNSSDLLIENLNDGPLIMKSDISMNDSSTNRNRGSIAESINLITEKEVRCHHVLEWNDPFEDRPITFRIRDF